MNYRTLIVLLSTLVFFPVLGIQPTQMIKLCKELKQYLEIRNYTAQENKQLSLGLTKTGAKELLAHADFSKGRTGINTLDTLNYTYHGFPLNLQHHKSLNKLVLTIGFHNQNSLHDVLLAYRNQAGKYWDVASLDDEYTTTLSKVKKFKTILVYLTPAATKKYQKDNRINDDITGIHELDDLNDQYEAHISNTFMFGSKTESSIALQLEFKHAITADVIDEYRELSCVEKVDIDQF